ncbi:MAG: class I SAM-dependent methyltransferase [Acidobacteria bacterium]|nr:class I SAM-dependent methyltransferase [Acidobacteriota bacterium]
MNRAAQQARFEELLREWAARVSLIGPAALRQLDLHIEEARLAGSLLQPSGEVLDFGSGNGLPGIPMAIDHPEARFHLVESDQKKWAFLKHVVRECGINAEVHGVRLERMIEKGELESRIDLIVSRAVGRPRDWMPAARSLLRPGARVALLATSATAPQVDGYEIVRREPLPRGDKQELVIYELDGKR